MNDELYKIIIICEFCRRMIIFIYFFFLKKKIK